MAMTAVWLKLDEKHFVQALQEAGRKLGGVENELILDFSSVGWIGPSALTAMEEFVGLADNKGVRVVLRGVNVSVYKVLKMLALAPRFSFES